MTGLQMPMAARTSTALWLLGQMAAVQTCPPLMVAAIRVDAGLDTPGVPPTRHATVSLPILAMGFNPKQRTEAGQCLNLLFAFPVTHAIVELASMKPIDYGSQTYILARASTS